MPESVNGGNGQGQPPKDMSMEMRLLLAFLLMGAVMFLTPYFFKSTTPPNAQKGVTGATGVTGPTGATAATNSAVTPAGKPDTAAPPPQASAEATPAASATPEKVEEPFIIDTKQFRVVFSNQGGTIRSWQLKGFNMNGNKPLELMNPASGLEHPFSLYFPPGGPQPTAKVNWAWYQQTGDPDGLGVTYAWSDGHTNIRKVFRFEKNSYLCQISSEVTIDGKPVPALLEWRGGFGDLTVANPAAAQRTLYFNPAENKLREQTVRDAKNGPVTASGNFSFSGLADTYFAAVFLPKSGDFVSQVTFADTVRTVLDQKAVPLVGVAVGEGESNHFELFVGPKDLDLLTRVNPKLTQVVDFGWMSVLAKPLFLIVNWFNDAFVHNFGWSIVVVTIVINFILFPLKLSNMKSMRKMQALKPYIDAINDKYKNIKMTDPRAGQKNQEVMDLYKKYGVNPMGGCVPMLLQIPFFFAFYKVFTVSVEMRGAPWLWVTDLSRPEDLPIKILPCIMIASQFFMQKMTPQANADPSQQKMMMFMPLIFGFMFYSFPSGLVLYYLTSNLVSMGQQWFFNHTAAADEAARSVEPPKKRNGRK